VGQDARFSDKQRSLMRQMTFPAVYSEKLSVADLQRIQLPVLTPWIHATVTALLGFDDDVVSSLVVNTLQQHKDDKLALDPRQLQLTLTGFLEHAAATFVESLWRLLISAAKEKSGIPQQLIDSKMRDIQRQQQQSSTSGHTHTAASTTSQQHSTHSSQREGGSSSIVSPSSSVQPSTSTSSVAVQSSRLPRAKSRFGPPLTPTQNAATAGSGSGGITNTRNSSSTTEAVEHVGKHDAAETSQPLADDSSSVKRQRIAR